MTTPGGASTTPAPVCSKATRTRRTGFYHRVGASMANRLRPFVVDRNIRHFLWYGVVAGEGLRSVGATSPSKSICSILPLTRHLRAGEVFSGSTPARVSLLFSASWARPFALAPSPRCAGPRVVRPCLYPVGRAHFGHVSFLCSSYRLL